MTFRTEHVTPGVNGYKNPTLFGKLTSGVGNGDIGIQIKNGYIHYTDDKPMDTTTTTFVADGEIHTLAYVYNGSNIKIYTEQGLILSLDNTFGYSVVPYGIFAGPNSQWGGESSNTPLNGELFSFALYKTVYSEDRKSVV